MKVLAINGSHRAGKGTAQLAQAALDAAADRGAETELVELSKLDIGYCVGCNRCLGKPMCSLSDDMDGLDEKLLAADGIILASPNYFSNVTARMKCFMDRTRPLHMVANRLKGKVGGGLVTTGLSDCGGEEALGVISRWFATQEMLCVTPRPDGEVRRGGGVATMFAAYEDGRVHWRGIGDDEIAFLYARQLGADIADLIARLG